MAEDNVVELVGRDVISDPLTDMLKKGAQQLIMQAVESELREFMNQYSEQRTEDGHACVVRNGHQPERELQTHPNRWALHLVFESSLHHLMVMK